MTATLQPLDNLVHADPDPETLAAMLDLIDHYLGRDVPQFGSAAWFALPADHPDRAAAVMLAAHAWWAATVFGAGIPASVLRQQVLVTLKAASCDVAGAADWPELVEHHRRQGRARESRAAFDRAARTAVPAC